MSPGEGSTMMMSPSRKSLAAAALVAGFVVTGAAVFAQQNTAPDHQAVRTGDDVELLDAQLGIKKAGIKKAEAHMELAKSNVARQDRLLKRGPNFVSEEEYAKAKAELAVAEAMLEIAQAELREMEVRFSQAKALKVLGTPIFTPAPNTEPKGDAGRASSALEGRLLNIERKLDLILKRLDGPEKEPHVEKGPSTGN
jgi:hypothetical protein